MANFTEEELANIGKEWLKVVALAKNEDIVAEHDHVRFRDSDLSIKGGALLGFAGLMLAADLVFLSAADKSFIAPHESCGYVGLAGLFLLMAGAFCAVLSIMISRKGTYQTAWSSFGLMKLYHDRRRRWLEGSAWLIAAGTLVYLASMLGQVASPDALTQHGQNPTPGSGPTKNACPLRGHARRPHGAWFGAKAPRRPAPRMRAPATTAAPTKRRTYPPLHPQFRSR